MNALAVTNYPLIDCPFFLLLLLAQAHFEQQPVHLPSLPSSMSRSSSSSTSSSHLGNPDYLSSFSPSPKRSHKRYASFSSDESQAEQEEEADEIKPAGIIKRKMGRPKLPGVGDTALGSFEGGVEAGKKLTSFEKEERKAARMVRNRSEYHISSVRDWSLLVKRALISLSLN